MFRKLFGGKVKFISELIPGKRFIFHFDHTLLKMSVREGIVGLMPKGDHSSVLIGVRPDGTDTGVPDFLNAFLGYSVLYHGPDGDICEIPAYPWMPDHPDQIRWAGCYARYQTPRERLAEWWKNLGNGQWLVDAGHQ